ncbi:hypothetical protein C6366_16765 [Desulfonatronum sp. SC1]|nr:hypothetical protein C6366_16765 [Desulfonatronum sp. SC1]
MYAPRYQLKNSQLLRRRKKFELSRMNDYASTLIRLPGRQIENIAQTQPAGAGHRTCPDSFFCSLHLGFLNGLVDKVIFTVKP